MRRSWWVRAQATERAGVIVIRDGRLAVIERCRAGRRYWVVPGGRVEAGEAVDEAARREAEEELGAAVRLGPLRVRLDRRKGDGRVQRQWYFEGTTDTDDIRVVGPELDRTADRGTYAAVWLDVGALESVEVKPRAVANAILRHHGGWPAAAITIDER